MVPASNCLPNLGSHQYLSARCALSACPPGVILLGGRGKHAVCMQVFQESTLELRLAGPRVEQVRRQADALRLKPVD